MPKQSSVHRSNTQNVRPVMHVLQFLNRGMVGGLLALLGAVAGLLLANSPMSQVFFDFSNCRIGPAVMGLQLSVGQWVSDGLLTVFFFATGLELITEVRLGSLRNPRTAAVPVLAACGGMVVPALIYAAVLVLGGDTGDLRGWAIPVSTDIAFAQCVFALAGKGLHRFLRVFLLTLATVDDLLGILVIALFYARDIKPVMLLAALLLTAVFAWLARWRRPQWWLMIVVALAAWVFMLHSGVEATIIGVLLGVSVPTRKVGDDPLPRSVYVQERVQPLTNAVVLPVFALFAAAIPLAGTGVNSSPFSQTLLWAVVAGLFIGKPLGVMAATAAATRWTGLGLPDGLRLRNLVPVSMLCGIGFTVSLLISGLSLTGPAYDIGRLGVLIGSVASACAGAGTMHIPYFRATEKKNNS